MTSSPNTFCALWLFSSLCLLCHAEESTRACASQPSAEQPPSDDSSFGESVSLLQLGTVLESSGRSHSMATDKAKKEISDERINKTQTKAQKRTCGDEVCNNVTMSGWNNTDACLGIVDAFGNGCCNWNPAEGGCMGCGDEPCHKVQTTCGDHVCNEVTMTGTNTEKACLAVMDAKSNGCCNWNPSEGGCMGCGDEPCRGAKPPIVVTAGTCKSRGYENIYDAAECKTAAANAGYTIKWGPHGGYQGVVEGCSVRFDKIHGNLFLQNFGSGHCHADWNNKCLCRPKATTTEGYYIQKYAAKPKKGMCQAGQQISTKDGCVEAAKALGLSLKNENVQVYNNPAWGPPGCWAQSGTKLWLNEASRNPDDCTDFAQCLCKSS